MSSDTWTPSEVFSNSEPFNESMWRLINKEGKSSTSKVVDTADEVDALEALVYHSRDIDRVDTGKLHRLIATPFQIRDSKNISRFRGPYDPGVLYAADSFECAAAEKSFRQVQVLKNSPEMTRIGPTRHTAIHIAIKTKVIDVRLGPYSKDAKIFADPKKYEKTQEFGRIAREAGLGGIVYKSVRSSFPARCIAVLTPKAIAKPDPISSDENWELTVRANTALWINSGSVNPPKSVTIVFGAASEQCNDRLRPQPE